MRLATVVFLALIAFTAGSRADSIAVGAAQDRDVLQTIARELCRNTKFGFKILDRRVLSTDSRQKSVDVESNALRDLFARNGESEALPAGVGCSRLRAIDAAHIERAFNPPGLPERVPADWDRFLTEFPMAQGIVRMSLPGFSDDRKIAVVLVSVSRGYYGDVGVIWQLGLKKEGWLVEKTAYAWIT